MGLRLSGMISRGILWSWFPPTQVNITKVAVSWGNQLSSEIYRLSNVTNVFDRDFTQSSAVGAENITGLHRIFPVLKACASAAENGHGNFPVLHWLMPQQGNYLEFSLYNGTHEPPGVAFNHP